MSFFGKHPRPFVFSNLVGLRNVYVYLYPRGIRAEQKSYGFKNLEKLGPVCSETNRIREQCAQKPIGSREQCVQKPIGSREQCAQKQIKPLRGPAPWAVLFIQNPAFRILQYNTVLIYFCSQKVVLPAYVLFSFSVLTEQSQYPCFCFLQNLTND